MDQEELLGPDKVRFTADEPAVSGWIPRRGRQTYLIVV
jgi:hypothetical protein